MATVQEANAMIAIKKKYGRRISMVEEATGLDKMVIYNLIYTESGGDAGAVGGDQDTGLTQLLPSTAVEIAGKLGYKDFKGEDDLQQQLLNNAGLNILFGAKYYSDQLKEAGGNHALAYSRYNGGPSYRHKVGEDGTTWRSGVYDAIASGDLSGTDEYSTNAKRFMDGFNITGYDPTGAKPPRKQASGFDPSKERPQTLIPSPGNIAPTRERPGVAEDPYRSGQQVSAMGGNIGAGNEPMREAPTRHIRKQLMDNPITGVPISFAEGAGDMMTGGYIPSSEEIHGPSDQPYNQVSKGAGGIAGLSAAMAAGGLSGIRGMATVGALQDTGEPVGSMHDVKNRIGTGGIYGATGGLLKFAPHITQGVIRKTLGPRASNAFVTAMENKAVRTAADVPAFTGMELAGGADLEEAVLKGIGGAMVTRGGAGPNLGRTRLRRSPAEAEMAQMDPSKRVGPAAEPELPAPQASRRGLREDIAQSGLTRPGELAELNAALSKPIPGSLASKTLADARDSRGHYNMDKVIEGVEAGGYEGYVAPGAREAAGKEAVKSFAMATKKGLVESGASPEAVKDGISKAITSTKGREWIKNETDRRALEPSMDPALVEAVNGQREHIKAVKNEVASAKAEGREPKDLGEGPAPWLVVTEAELRAQEFTTPLRWWQGRGGGKVGYDNVIDKVFTRSNQEIQDMTLDIGDQLREFKVGWAKKHGIKVDSNLDKKITGLLESGDISDPAAWELRDAFESYHYKMTRMNRGLGGNDFGYIENYAGPEYEKPTGSMEVGKRMKGSIDPILGLFRREQRVDGGRKPEVAEPGQWQNPRRMRRTGKTENPEMSSIRRLEQFNQNLTNDIGHNFGIRVTEAKARYLETSGFPGMAKAAVRYTNDVYKGKKYGMTGKVEAIGKLPVFSTVGDILSWNRRRLYESVFPGNIAWTIGVQPSSSVLGLLNSGGKNSIDGTRLFSSPEFMGLVDKLFYAKLKSRGRGSAFSRTQEDNSMLSARDETTTSPREQMIEGLSIPGSVMEKRLGYWSAAGHFLYGKELGLSGRELLDYMSDGIAKDQSSYDQYTRSLILRSKDLNNLFPFKGFMFETVEALIEKLGGGVIPHGQYAELQAYNKQARKERAALGGPAALGEGPSAQQGRREGKQEGKQEGDKTRASQNLERIVSLISGAMLMNLWNESIRGRGVYNASVIPGHSELLGGGDLDNSGLVTGGTAPVNTARNFYLGRKKMERAIRERNVPMLVDGLVKALGGWIPAGAELKRLASTYSMAEGNGAYGPENLADVFHSAVMGPSATRQGKEFWNQRNETAGKSWGVERALFDEMKALLDGDDSKTSPPEVDED